MIDCEMSSFSLPKHVAPATEVGGSAQFVPTHWTMVLAAGQAGPDQSLAMEQFARTYWYPIYAYIRRKGMDTLQAEDLTQGFFEDLLATKWMAGVERRGSRFSTLLLTILNRYLVDHHRRERAAKRGGGVDPISIDMADGELWYGQEPSTQETPETIFERRYALSVLHSALEGLGMEMRASGRGRSRGRVSMRKRRWPCPSRRMGSR
jgi:DNA-directed RNA polymerase specialized sigma24 family protein